MTLEQALRLRAGEKVISRFTSPPFRPLTITEVWVNDHRTIVRFRIHALRDAWIDSSGVEPAPPPEKHR